MHLSCYGASSVTEYLIDAEMPFLLVSGVERLQNLCFLCLLVGVYHKTQGKIGQRFYPFSVEQLVFNHCILFCPTAQSAFMVRTKILRILIIDQEMFKIIQALTSIEVCVGARTIIMVTSIDVVGHGAVRAIVQRVNRTRYLYVPQLHHKPTHSIGRTFASL